MKNIGWYLLAVVGAASLFSYYNNDNLQYSNTKNNGNKLINSNDLEKIEINFEKRDNLLDKKNIKMDTRAITIEKEKKNISNSNDEDSLNIPRREMLKMIGGNEKSLRIFDQYNKAEYDPAFDETWQYDMEGAVYAEVYNSALKGRANVESYQCNENNRCNLHLSLLEKNEKTMKEVSDYILNLRDQPSIMKSGKQRDVFITNLRLTNEQSSVEISIGNR